MALAFVAYMVLGAFVAPEIFRLQGELFQLPAPKANVDKMSTKASTKQKRLEEQHARYAAMSKKEL